MRVFTRALVALITVVSLSMYALGGAANAQVVNQIELTDQIMTRFIAVQKELSVISEELQKGDGSSDPNLEAKLEAIATKHGFKSFTDFEDVATSINIVLSGLDSDSGAFTDPHDTLKKELAETEADVSLPADEKKRLVEELKAELEATPPLRYPGNVDVVKKYRTQIEEALQ